MKTLVLNHNLLLNLNPPGCVSHGESKITIKNKIKRGVAVLTILMATMVSVIAQPTEPPVDPLMQLMLTQPSIEISTNVEIRAGFDPPVIAPGGKSTYRVTINAVSDSIRWPEDIYAPMELTVRRSARGQILQNAGDKLRPATTINHHVTASTTGSFTIPGFKVKVYGRPVPVPAARLEVLPQAGPAAPPLRLYLELAETNVYCGQPVKVRVVLPAAGGNAIQGLTQVQINGDGILLDQTAVRQRIQQLDFNGRTGPAFLYESVLTPLVAGRLDLTAQAFTAGNQFSGIIVLPGQTNAAGGPPQYVLLDSEAVRLNVEPLPRAGLLPGFTGAIGQFRADPPQLSANAVRSGDVVKLLVTFRTEGEIKRLLAPPPPAVTNWQVFPPLPEGGLMQAASGGSISSAQTFSYTMIPLTNSMTATPAIPFSYFDPQRKTYVDLTIPPVPIRVTAGAATAEAQAIAQAAATPGEPKLTLSALAPAPGPAAASLVPLQLRGGFRWLQLGLLAGFAGLGYWDWRRRFLEQHPEIVARRRAKRALRRERTELQKAVRAGDAARFARAAVNALRVAAAPHFPAAPRALVGRDVLELFNAAERAGRTGAVVRKFFAATDAMQFSPTAGVGSELLDWQPELDRVLDELEAKL